MGLVLSRYVARLLLLVLFASSARSTTLLLSLSMARYRTIGSLTLLDSLILDGALSSGGSIGFLGALGDRGSLGAGGGSSVRWFNRLAWCSLDGCFVQPTLALFPSRTRFLAMVLSELTASLRPYVVNRVDGSFIFDGALAVVDSLRTSGLLRLNGSLLTSWFSYVLSAHSSIMLLFFTTVRALAILVLVIRHGPLLLYGTVKLLGSFIPDGALREIGSLIYKGAARPELARSIVLVLSNVLTRSSGMALFATLCLVLSKWCSLNS
jgi:hypothetical protein